MPDVVKRLEKGLPLDVPIDPTTLYNKGSNFTREEKIRGYNDYPAETELLVHTVA
jgi:hypothetical protein